MKRMWWAIAFLSICICLCYYEQVNVNKFYKTISNDINIVQSQIEKENKEATTLLINDFKRFKLLAKLIIDNESLKELNILIAKIGNESKNEKIKALTEMRALIDSIYDSHKLNLANII